LSLNLSIQLKKTFRLVEKELSWFKAFLKWQGYSIFTVHSGAK